MRYIATVTTYTPDGRVIEAGKEYDFPRGDSESPDTISEIAALQQERDEEIQAKFRGEVPVKRGPGRPKKVWTPLSE